MTPDLIVTGGALRTFDPARPAAQALAVRRGRIIALGSDADILDLAGPGTRRLDAGGRAVWPGLQDAHIHLLAGGMDLAHAASLHAVADAAGLVAALAAQAARQPRGLVTGTGWQPGPFDDATLTRDLLDRAVPDRPCIAIDSSGHNACLNSAACRLAGVDDATRDPPNGRILRDAAGRPTGMLHEDAVPWALARLPQPGPSAWQAVLAAGMAHANAHGITGILDAKLEDEAMRAAYAAAEAAGALTLRVGASAWVRADEDDATAIARLTDWRARHGSDLFHIHGAKVFLDGVIENGTAAMLAPLADGANAPLMFAPDRIARLFPALDAARFQIHVHAIGDAAVRAALDGLAAARRANGWWPARHQIAHLQVTAAADLPRLCRLGAQANIQPLWAAHAADPALDVWMDALGPDRLARAYAFRAMLDAGADGCLSSDWPVSSLNPFEIIEVAVTRQPPGDPATPPFHPEQRLTLAEAAQGYTSRAAAACWREGFTGALRPGASADLIVLDQDPFAVPPHRIGATRVLLTLFRGAEVHRAQGLPG